MSFFDELLGKLFPPKTRQASVVHEVITRSADYLERYQKWQEEEASRHMQEIGKAYHYRQAGIGHPLEVHLLNSPYANGFALAFPKGADRQEARFLIDTLRDKVLAAGYRLAQSDRRITDRDGTAREAEKHYLKPPYKAQKENIDQLYGNVSVELVLLDNAPDHLKLTASVYSDRLYQEARPFSELAERIFGQPGVD